jgi:hypothetical protein
MKYLTESPKWVTFYPTLNQSLFIEKAAYFDERPQVHASVTQLLVLLLLPVLICQSAWFLFLIPFVFFGWGTLYIHLPIKTGIQDCDSAAWGFNYHDNKIWIYIGGGGNFEGGRKWKTFTMPWDMTWVRTSTLLSDNTWFHETKGNRKKWKGDEYGTYDWLQANRWKEVYPFTDKYDNTSINTTIGVSEREWRPLWFMWTKLFSKSQKTIDVDFDKEVGKRKGSWKGGTLGCGYNLLPNETPLECLKRMEKERAF